MTPRKENNLIVYFIYIYTYFFTGFYCSITQTLKSTLLMKRLFSWKMGIVIYVLAIMCVECISDIPLYVNCLSFPRVAQPYVLPVYTYESGLVDVFFCPVDVCLCFYCLILAEPFTTGTLVYVQHVHFPILST